MNTACPLEACPHSYYAHDWCESGPVCCIVGCPCGLRTVSGIPDITDSRLPEVPAAPGETYANANQGPIPTTESEMTETTDPIADLVHAVLTEWAADSHTPPHEADDRIRNAATDAVRAVLDALERAQPGGYGPMPTSQGVRGYRNLTRDQVALINWVKYREDDLARAWARVERDSDTDPRWLNVARTHFQEGFSALVRAIAKPHDPFAAYFANNQQDEAEQVIPRRGA